MTQTSSSTAIIPGFPLWRYLRQPLFHSTTILNPFLFWHRYQLQVRDPISFLEACWTLNYKATSEK